jgi:hypothetical protein
MSTLPRDNNRVPLRNGDWVTLTKDMVFAGGTENDPGDFDGTGNPATLFTVSGVVTARIFGVCTVNLAGGGSTLEVGSAIATPIIIAQTSATGIDAGDIWHDASPDRDIEDFAQLEEYILVNDVIQTVGSANITAGAITYYCLWKPISEGATVTAA